MNTSTKGDVNVRLTSRDPYLGYHNRSFPDYNGWDIFMVWVQNGSNYYWIACDDDSNPRGFSSGPFDNAREAYKDAGGM